MKKESNSAPSFQMWQDFLSKLPISKTRKRQIYVLVTKSIYNKDDSYLTKAHTTVCKQMKYKLDSANHINDPERPLKKYGNFSDWKGINSSFTNRCTEFDQKTDYK